MKKCPYCEEDIRYEMMTCPFCAEVLQDREE